MSLTTINCDSPPWQRQELPARDCLGFALSCAGKKRPATASRRESCFGPSNSGRDTLAYPHRQQELDVALGLFQLVEQQFHRFHRRHARQRAAQHHDAAALIRVIEEFLFSGAGSLDVDRWENATVHQSPIQMY